jgi:hypothetical protein
MKTNSVLGILKKTCEGLVFTSETDAPLEPFVWNQKETPTPESLAKAAGLEKGTPTETTDLAAFFRAVPKADKAKFNALTKVLKEHLTDIQVYKVGEVDIKVYILGKTKDGGWAGLTTEAVET